LLSRINFDQFPDEIMRRDPIPGVRKFTPSIELVIEHDAPAIYVDLQPIPPAHQHDVLAGLDIPELRDSHADLGVLLSALDEVEPLSLDGDVSQLNSPFYLSEYIYSPYPGASPPSIE
jgi:hypothetical protein